MKKTFLPLAIILLTVAGSFAQRIAFVDTDYILKQIPEYIDAQKKLDDLSAQWEKDIQTKYTEIDLLYKKFQAEQVLLTEEMRQQRQKEIVDKETAVKNYQKEKFGYNGELFQKRQELIKPIQDRVYDEVQKLATAKSYNIILDKSSANILYGDEKYDLSDEILKSLGVTPK